MVVPVLELENRRAVCGVAPGLFPKFRRVQRGQIKFLRPNGVHLLANNPDDLQQGSLRQEEMRIYPRRNLANVSRPQQQAMAGNFCFGGILPQSRNKNLAPTHDIDLSL